MTDFVFAHQKLEIRFLSDLDSSRTDGTSFQEQGAGNTRPRTLHDLLPAALLCSLFFVREEWVSQQAGVHPSYDKTSYNIVGTKNQRTPSYTQTKRNLGERRDKTAETLSFVDSMRSHAWGDRKTPRSCASIMASLLSPVRCRDVELHRLSFFCTLSLYTSIHFVSYDSSECKSSNGTT